ncbi:MAG: hypothetical protein WCS73_09050, partial [Lentisphaeria bacterium]
GTATSLSSIQTSRCFVDPPRSGARTCVVLDFKYAVVMGTYVYKNQQPCKNGRKIFRPYNFNRFIRHSGDFNFSVKKGVVNHSHASLMGTATSLSSIQTSRCFVDPPRSGARTCVVFDFKHRLSWQRLYPYSKHNIILAMCLFYHIIFRTKYNEQTINKAYADDLYRYIWGIIKNKKGAF